MTHYFDKTIKMQPPRWVNLGLLLFFIYQGGTLALMCGKDLTWDVTNYHYYNPYALFHFRFDKDYWPATINTYLNPTLDFLTYFLIKYFKPAVTGFIFGAIHGVNFWLIFRIACVYTGTYSISILLTLIAIYSPQVLSGIGTTFGDLSVSILILAGIYWIAKILKKFREENILFKFKINLSGFVFGLAAGLKLTVAVYLISGFLAFMCLYPLMTPKRILILALTWGFWASLGLMLTSGYWMFFLYYKFHNPFFPFYNGIFHSPFFPAFNWQGIRFFPHNVFQATFYPFYFSWNGMTADYPFRDFRFAVLYVLFILLFAQLLLQDRRATACPRDPEKSMLLEQKWLIIFFILSYIFWEYLFSIMRYIISLELLTPLMIYLCIKHLLKRKEFQLAALTLIYAILLFTMRTTIWDRGSWQTQNYFGISIPNKFMQITNALVIFPTVHLKYPKQGPLTLAYLIPFFPESWRFASTPYTSCAPNTVAPELKKIIYQHQGPIFLMATANVMPELKKTMEAIGLHPNQSCTVIQTEREFYKNKPVTLCASIVKY